MTATTFVILGLAAYRGARAVSIDSITQPVRDWAEMRGGWIDGLLHCGFCTSFWTAAMSYLAAIITGYVDPETAVLVKAIHWWAIAGLASMLIAIDTFLLREAPPK